MDFVSKFKYLSVMFQMKGCNSDRMCMMELQLLRTIFPMTVMTFCWVAFDLLCMHTLLSLFVLTFPDVQSAISNQLCEDNYFFLDLVQGSLVKLWFGVSKFASTSSLVTAVEWENTPIWRGNRTKHTQPSAPFLCQITHCHVRLISRRV